LDLELKTQKRQAEIKFSDDHLIWGHLFTAASLKGFPGIDSVIRLLNDERSYIPFEFPEGEISLLQKETIVSVRMDVSQMPRDLPFQNRSLAKFYLLSGDTLQGTVFVDLPKTHTRLSDFLNFSKKFIFIGIDGQDVFVNTKFIKMVSPVE
jgi:hypothetical protein